MHIHHADAASAATQPVRPDILLAVYLLPIFLGAMLMFWSEMLVAKLALPFLGGTPMVWTTCMLFFQTLLLAGYACVHWGMRIAPRAQALLYISLVAVSLAFLPIGANPARTPPPNIDPRPWLIAWLSFAIGGPFLILSAAGPMLQSWFARTSHPDAANPYFLYVASNAGSLIGLLAFPILAEPQMTLLQQSEFWSWLYAVFAGLVVVAGFTVRRVPPPAAITEADSEAPSWQDKSRWILLAFIPSSLLLGLTSLIATDIAAVPLIWMLPLAAYLITFMIAFARHPLIPHWATVALFPTAALPPLFFWFFNGNAPTFLVFGIHFAAFFLSAMFCHGELARSRPAARHLTTFYLCLALGGALGGVFNAVIAPLIFSRVFEYPLVILLSFLLRRQDRPSGKTDRRLDLLIPVGWLVALIAISGLVRREILPDSAEVLTILGLLLGLFCIQAQHRPHRFALMASGLVLAGVIIPLDDERIVFRNRNFFGIVRVVDDAENKARYLYHGTTAHGAQHTDHRRLMAVSYYAADGPLGDVFRLPQIDRTDATVAAIGLGAGTIACLARMGQRMTFYEIDPAVAQVARDSTLFTFLRDCPAKSDVILGDGRLMIERAAAKSFDLIVLDAFSSDAIPVHLMTREAMEIYRSKLKEEGMMMFHISNRYLDLTRVIAPLARDAGLVTYFADYSPPDSHDNDVVLEASWVLVVPPGEAAETIGRNPAWNRLEAEPDTPVWTDSFSNLFGVIR